MSDSGSNIGIVATHASPLCILPSGKLLYYKFGDIYIWNGNAVERKIHVIDTFKERWLSRIKVLHRLLRLGVRTAMALNEDIVLLSIGNFIFELDLQTGILSNGYFCGEGIRPLIFTKIDNLPSFENGVYFGGYLSNSNKNPVSIYRRSATDSWEIVYTFPHGEINHVHCIVSDTYRKCVWIFTGDFDNASAIWRVDNGFKNVVRFLSGNQIYRGCVVFSLPEGLLYATDTPFADNYIFILNPDTKELTNLRPIAGSCIYGCQWQNKYVFSSTIEGDGRNTSKLDFYFGRKNGAGIKGDDVHLYVGDINNGFADIYQQRKDFMPYYTFQFGVFKFPYGFNNSENLYFQQVATSQNDLAIMTIKR